MLRPVIKKHVSFQYWVGWAFFSLLRYFVPSAVGWLVGRFGFFWEYIIIKRTELARLLYIYCLALVLVCVSDCRLQEAEFFSTKSLTFKSRTARSRFCCLFVCLFLLLPLPLFLIVYIFFSLTCPLIRSQFSNFSFLFSKMTIAISSFLLPDT